MQKVKALFLDRDGVVCEALNPSVKGGYLTSIDQLKLVFGIENLIDSAIKKGYLIFVVTNQPQIAKGLMSEKKLNEIHLNMNKFLGGKINKIYYCPHIDQDNCDCRKPKTGMFLKAISEFNVDSTVSFVVGDRYKDIVAGQKIGAATIFLKNKFNKDCLKKCKPTYVVSNLSEIIDLI